MEKGWAPHKGTDQRPVIIHISILIALTVAVIALLIAPRMAGHRVVFEDSADQPKPFGREMSWIAIRSSDTAAVLAALELTGARPANWNSGVGTIYDADLSDAYVFVSPPVKGWTYVAGVPLPHPVGRGFADKLTPLLASLSKDFKDVQYFASFPIIDFFGWARIEAGRWVRAFAVAEEGVVWNRGRLTREERSLGLKLFEVRGIKNRKGDAGGPILLHPTEEQVLRVAAGWGLNPARLNDDDAEPGTGYVARAPSSWRAERLRKAA